VYHREIEEIGLDAKSRLPSKTSVSEVRVDDHLRFSPGDLVVQAWDLKSLFLLILLAVLVVWACRDEYAFSLEKPRTVVPGMQTVPELWWARLFRW
jgi:hypothetical protein